MVTLCTLVVCSVSSCNTLILSEDLVACARIDYELLLSLGADPLKKESGDGLNAIQHAERLSFDVPYPHAQVKSMSNFREK